MSTLAAITLGIALLGAVLGILNTWRSFDRDRVKLRVVPKIAMPIGKVQDRRPRLCIEVRDYAWANRTICA